MYPYFCEEVKGVNVFLIKTSLISTMSLKLDFDNFFAQSSI
ncbi:hypothetical protein NEOC65_002128 [Neochlamydia sp. AcF65]|nr:hypothetical protein [Neochlamydia sp. AcF65]MBS4169973.1 hypothetical protein [Neochlamydia sp. AcF95]